MKKFICIDIGGTNTRIQVRNVDNQIISKTTFLTIKGPAKLTFKKIVLFVNDYQKNHKIEGIGISTPGPTNYIKGIFYNLPNNPEWNNFKFIEYLWKATKIKNIRADNDANLMALAHHFEFKKSDDDITQFFTISTGLGAGLIINNEIYKGFNHSAQEVAFAPVSFNPEKSSRFGKGALEHFSAGSGIAVRARSKYKSTKNVFKNYKNDSFAKKIIDEGIDTLGNMIAISLAIINPSLLVFDGSIARHNKWYVNKAIEKARKNSMPVHFKDLTIHFGKKGDDAAIEGAFYLISNL